MTHWGREGREGTQGTEAPADDNTLGPWIPYDCWKKPRDLNEPGDLDDRMETIRKLELMYIATSIVEELFPY